MPIFEQIEYAGQTDVGVRRSHNQDAYTVVTAHSDQAWQMHGHIFIVADGMGGHAVGEKASVKASRDIPLLFQKYADEGPATALRKAFSEANFSIYTIGQENPEFKGLGTTGSMLVLRPDGAWIGHVGDSRIYRIRDDHIEQLTFDHSYVWEMARRMRISPDKVKGVKSNVIIRSLGPESMVNVDVEGPHPLRPNDTFVLCSDGLSNLVSEQEIGLIVSALPPKEACQLLIDFANLRGGPDNITVIIVRVLDLQTPESPPRISPLKQIYDVLRRVPWPIWTMISAVILLLLSVNLFMMQVPGARFVFVLALALVIVGFVGLAVQNRQPQEEVLINDSPPGKLHIYRRFDCKLDETFLTRLEKGEESLIEKLRENDWKYDEAKYRQHSEAAKEAFAKGDWPACLRERCRAVSVLARVYNKHRQHEESFSPKWDMVKASHDSNA